MNERSKTILIVTLFILIMLIIVGGVEYLFLLEENKKDIACEELGGETGNTILCYKEDHNGELVGYRVKLLGGEYKLVKN